MKIKPKPPTHYRDLRLKTGLSAKHFSKLIGVSEGTISNIEHKKVHPSATVELSYRILEHPHEGQEIVNEYLDDQRKTLESMLADFNMLVVKTRESEKPKIRNKVK